MFKKTFAVVTAVAVFALAGVASAATMADLGGMTLRQGSTGTFVSSLQAALNTCTGSALSTDGKFGPATTTAVKAFQASKSLNADGVVGAMTKQALIGCGVNSNPNNNSNSNSNSNSSSTLKGGAGSANVTSTSTGVESDVKEGATENVLGFRVEADGSDIEVTGVRFTLKADFANLSTMSNRPSRYMETVSVMMEDEEVGSIDVADLSRDGNDYTGYVTLDDAVVREDKKVDFYLTVEASESVDSVGAKFDIGLTQIRYMDAENVVVTSNSTIVDEFGFDDISGDDKIDLKSSSANPDARSLKVEDTDKSDEYLVLAAKLDVDEDSSDIDIFEFPVYLDVAGATNPTGSITQIIDKVRVEIDGKDMDADLDVAGTLVGGAATGVKYVADFDGDLTIDADDVVDVKVYVTFNDQSGNYSATTSTVKATIMPAQIIAEGEDGVTVGGGNRIGNTFGLKLTGTEFSNYAWSETEGASVAVVDFFVTVKAEDGSFTLDESTVIGTRTFNTTAAAIGVGDITLSKISGDADTVTAGSVYTVADGETARFRVRFNTQTALAEANISSIGGQEVPDDKQLSPTAVAQ